MKKAERVHLERPLSRKTYCGLWVRWQTVVGAVLIATCRNCKRIRKLEIEAHQKMLEARRLG